MIEALGLFLVIVVIVAVACWGGSGGPTKGGSAGDSTGSNMASGDW